MVLMLLPAVVSAVITFSAWFIHCFVYAELTPLELTTVGPCDCSTGFFVCAHFDKAEALGVTCFTIKNDLCGGNASKIREQIAEAVFGSVVREIADVKFLGHRENSFSRKCVRVRCYTVP